MFYDVILVLYLGMQFLMVLPVVLLCNLPSLCWCASPTCSKNVTTCLPMMLCTLHWSRFEEIMFLHVIKILLVYIGGPRHNF